MNSALSQSDCAVQLAAQLLSERAVQLADSQEERIRRTALAEQLSAPVDGWN
jgi:hypothetical protein